MSEFIGKFTAPGTGDVGVLGIELTHDFATGTKEGVVRLEKRPYWEGGATPFTLEMPATSERAAMHLTGLWIERGLYDGEGCCNVTVTGVTMRSAVPAAPTLDELTDPADLDWGTIRSTCAARDWRAAWGVVGTDHAGDATPGEVYLLAVARRASATAAALHHWRKAEMESGTIFVGADAARAWQRIKGIAAWESSARAQYDERGNRRGRLQAALSDIYARRLAGHEAAAQARLYGRSATWAVIDDHVGSFQQEYQGIPASDDTFTRTLHSLYNAEDDAVTRGNGRGVVGVLNNPYLTAAAQRGELTGTVTIPPSASATIAAALERYASMTGNTMNVQADGARIVVTPRNTNPAPRGPQTRKRR